MRDTSSKVSKQIKQKFSQGGEIKVMKKSLSLVLAMSMVFGSFSAMASAAEAELTVQQKYDALATKGIFVGKGDKGAALEDNMTRAEFARVSALLLGLNVTTVPAASKFSDVALKHWAVEEVHAVDAKNVMTGLGNGTFGPSSNVTAEQVARVLVDALGLTPAADAPAVAGASAWAYGYIKTAVDNGIIPADSKWTAPAKRALLVTAAYTAEAALNVPAEFAVVKAAQTGAKKITVDFNRVLTAAEVTALTAEVKNGLVAYPVTIKASEDKKSVVLEASFLPAAEYTVVINKLAAVKVTTVASVVSKVELGVSALQATYAQDLQVKALNQFNEDTKESVAIQAFSSQNGDLASKLSAGKLDLSGEKVDNTVVVTAIHYATGLSASKTFKLVAGSSATVIQLGQVAPLKDKSRITAGETGLILPVTLKDQYGTTIKLPKTNATNTSNVSVLIGGINFVVSDVNVVDTASFAVNADGVVTFTAKAEGTVVITAVNAATGASASTVVKVEAASALKTLQVSAPGSIVVVGEAVIFPYVAADTFGAPIANKDVPAKVAGLAANSTGFVIQANGLPVGTKWKANGDLELTFSAKGNQNVIVWYKGAIASQFNVTVNDIAYPVAITGTKDIKTTLTVGASQDLKLGNLVIQDNYGRALTSLAASGYSLTFADEAGVSLVTYAADKVTATAVGSEKVTATLTKGTSTISHDIVFNVIKDADVKTITVGTVGTVYAANAAGAHSVELSLTGKTDAGAEVAIVAGSFYDLVTSSNTSVVAVESGLKFHGVAEGTATVTVWKNGAKLGEQTVTVSKAAPVATTVKFTAAEVTTSATVDVKAKVEVKDQYGVAKADAGKFYSSNKDVATVDASTGVVTKVANGVVTITYITENGLSATILVNVENA